MAKKEGKGRLNEKGLPLRRPPAQTTNTPKNPPPKTGDTKK